MDSGLKRSASSNGLSDVSSKRSKANIASAPLSTALSVLQSTVLSTSSAVFAFDTWPEVIKESSTVFKMESRAGAGTALSGFLTNAKDGSGPVTALANPATLLLMASALNNLPSIADRPSLVIHIAAKPDELPDVLEAIRLIAQEDGWKGDIVFSGGAGSSEIVQAVGFTQSSGNDLIHIFDGLEAGRELATQQSLDTSLQEIQPFSYFGPADASAVILLPSSLHSATAAAALEAVGTALKTVGILVARVASTSSEAGLFPSLVNHLPQTTETVYAFTAALSSLDDADKGCTLYEAALAASLDSDKLHAAILPLPVAPSWTVNEWAAALVRAAAPSSSKAFVTPTLKPLLPDSSKLATFWSGDVGSSAPLASTLAQTFARNAQQTDGGVVPRLLETFDNLAGGKGPAGLGIKSGDLVLSPPAVARSSTAHPPSTSTTETPFAVSAIVSTSIPQLVFIATPQSILTSYNPLERIGPNTQILFSSTWEADEYTDKLSAHEKQKLVSRGGAGAAYTINPELVAADLDLKFAGASALVEQAAFWEMYMPSGQAASGVPDDETKVGIIASLLESSSTEQIVGGIATFTKIVSATRRALKAVVVRLDADEAQPMEIDGTMADADEAGAAPKKGNLGAPVAPAEADAAVVELPSSIALSTSSIGPNAFKTFADEEPDAPKTWHLAAQHLLFPEAYALPIDEKEKMRPDLAEENFVVTVTENRRLTPSDYDRNVFHIEFSTAGTGLKYSVGEALGVHGLNDSAEVLDFIEWYGLDPQGIVNFPSRENPRGRIEQRSIFQIFQQNLDIFGKPPKAFYEALSKAAISKEEARHLRFIASAEGSSTFKKWSELETVTYADVLKAFPSTRANFGLAEIVKEVASIKPRHYSIASSQNAVGDSVHLLVVTVDWQNTKGVTRYGQCTRYLADLKVGAKVMVSVKPSVMKLPPRDTQPIIMAGLGTGAAPFRAFMQERAWQRTQGIDVGPLLYYFGARYRSAEYLYGEEIEAYVRDGVISHTGLAFSRDTKAKVYIQHKMKADSKLLADAMEDGVFYLCGPTWPVPDVYEALVESFKQKGKTEDEAKNYIEELKEDERYVLEVY